MRLLTDQDLYYMTIEWLRAEGHDVVTARELDLHQASDEELLRQSLSNGSKTAH